MSSPDRRRRPSRRRRRPCRWRTAETSSSRRTAAVRRAVLASNLSAAPKFAVIAENPNLSDLPRSHRSILNSMTLADRVIVSWGTRARMSRRPTFRSRTRPCRRQQYSAPPPRRRVRVRVESDEQFDESLIGATVVIRNVIVPVASFDVATCYVRRPSLGVTGRIGVRRVGDAAPPRRRGTAAGDDPHDEDPEFQASAHCLTPP